MLLEDGDPKFESEFVGVQTIKVKIETCSAFYRKPASFTGECLGGVLCSPS
jgi:hypothetical protein